MALWQMGAQTVALSLSSLGDEAAVSGQNREVKYWGEWPDICRIRNDSSVEEEDK